jgi:lipoprotein signal peptidase
MFIVYGGLGNIVDRSLGNLILLNKYDKSRYIKI